jgi:quercetin dioxygenase-like cupin family protein
MHARATGFSREAAMTRTVTIVSIGDIDTVEAGIGRAGRMLAKGFPLDTGVPGVGMEFAWTYYFVGYGTPRHKHTFDQFRYALEGPRQIQDGVLMPGDAGFYPEGVHYGPQLQDQPSSGLGLQFQGPAGVPYLTHEALQNARTRLQAEGGTFSGGVYTRVLPDGRKINKDSHAACFEAITGKQIEFPDGRFASPIIMRTEAVRWIIDRHLPGIEHKHLGSFGEHRSGVRISRLAPGAKIPAHRQEDAEILYLTEGSITYDGKTWLGGKTKDVGTYMFIQHGADVKEIATATGGTFFVISLPMLADIEAERAAANNAAKTPARTQNVTA